MHKHTAKQLVDYYLPMLRAFADGQKVQYMNAASAWQDVGFFNFQEFDRITQLRIKPEPKLRPWKPEEVPIGAQARTKENPEYRYLITSFCSRGICFGFDNANYAPSELVNNFEHSTDGGKTWLPCGVLEVA